jgi:hypothetical protein
MIDITKSLANFNLTKEQPIEHIINTSYKIFSLNDKIKHLSKSFIRHKYVLVVNDYEMEEEKEVDYFVCQSKDVIRLFLKKQSKKYNQII